MPLRSGIVATGGNLPAQIRSSVDRILGLMDRFVAQFAREKGLAPSQVRLLRPCNFCAIVNDDSVFVVVTNVNVGGISNYQYIDWSGKPMNLQTAVFLAERDLSYERAFGFTFSRKVLDASDVEKENTVRNLAEAYINDEIINLERLNRIVRFNPIFQGRDYMLNDNLVFVLTPFKEPFNTIYTDHIKPTVESI
jgi:hypothetical protein